MYTFLSSVVIAKAAGERPELAPQSIGPVCLDVTGEIDGQPVAFQVIADGIGIGAPTEATATCRVSTYDLLARVLRRVGCTGPAVEAIVLDETAALLRGDAVDSKGIEAIVARLQKEAAASLPKVPRAGAVSVRGAAILAVSPAAVGVAAK
jgi:hypothetical protein